MSKKLEDQIADLQVALSHAEKQIEELSELAQNHWKEMQRLNAKLSRTQNQLEDHMAAVADGREREAMSVTEMAARDKPPHY